MSAAWDGLLLLDKPSGPTSHDLVDRVRRATGQRRVGHGGTLDPLASGLLPLVLGHATRLVRFLPHSPKTYTGTLRLGVRTDTDDVTGETLERHVGALPSPTAVLEAAAHFRGRMLQRPPAFSARKVDGQRSYRLARCGIAVPTPPTEVEIDRFQVEPEPSSAEHWRFAAVVSGGTYVRSLVRDLGQRLGCGAALAELRRTRIGPLLVEAALAVDAAGRPSKEDVAAALISPEQMPLEPPTVRLVDDGAALSFLQGRPLELPDGPDAGWVRVVAHDGRLLGLAERRETLFQPRVVLSRG